jgi:hypothetical protein
VNAGVFTRWHLRNERLADELEAEDDMGPAPPLEAAAYDVRSRERAEVLRVHQLSFVLVHGVLVAIAITVEEGRGPGREAVSWSRSFRRRHRPPIQE